MPIILPLDQAERRMYTSAEIDAIRAITLCTGDLRRAYGIGELCLFEDGAHTYLDRCIGHSPDYRAWYFRTLAVF